MTIDGNAFAASTAQADAVRKPVPSAPVIGSAVFGDYNGNARSMIDVAALRAELSASHAQLARQDERIGCRSNMPAPKRRTAMEALGRDLGVSRAMYFDVHPDLETLTHGTAYVDGVPAVPPLFRLSAFGCAR